MGGADIAIDSAAKVMQQWQLIGNWREEDEDKGGEKPIQ
jgi:hypothetical protein